MAYERKYVLVCFKCGSENVSIFSDNYQTVVYQCNNCNNKFAKRKIGVGVSNGNSQSA